MLRDLLMFIHDFVSHPLMAIFRLMGLNIVSRVVHDLTLPADMNGAIVINGDEYMFEERMAHDDIGALLSEVFNSTNGRMKAGCVDQDKWAVSFIGRDGEWHTFIEDTAVDACLSALVSISEGT